MLDNGINMGDTLNVKIYNYSELIWTGDVKLVNTFGDVPENENMAYFNSELNFSVAVNMALWLLIWKIFLKDIKYTADQIGA